MPLLSPASLVRTEVGDAGCLLIKVLRQCTCVSHCKSARAHLRLLAGTCGPVPGGTHVFCRRGCPRGWSVSAPKTVRRPSGPTPDLDLTKRRQNFGAQGFLQGRQAHSHSPERLVSRADDGFSWLAVRTWSPTKSDGCPVRVGGVLCWPLYSACGWCARSCLTSPRSLSTHSVIDMAITTAM